MNHERCEKLLKSEIMRRLKSFHCRMGKESSLSLLGIEPMPFHLVAKNSENKAKRRFLFVNRVLSVRSSARFRNCEKWVKQQSVDWSQTWHVASVRVNPLALWSFSLFVVCNYSRFIFSLFRRSSQGGSRPGNAILYGNAQVVGFEERIPTHKLHVLTISHFFRREGKRKKKLL